MNNPNRILPGIISSMSYYLRYFLFDFERLPHMSSPMRSPVVLPIVFVIVAIIYLTLKDSHECTLLIEGVEDRDLNEIKALLQDGHHVDCQDREGWTPLCHAVKLGFNDIVMGLLHAKGDPSRPLYIAAEYDRYKSVSALISYGADPNKDYMGKSALYIAVKNTQKNAVNVLLEANANPNIIFMGCSLLCNAVEIGNNGVITQLLKYNADPNVADEVGRTPLYVAVEKNNAWAVSILLEYGADCKKIFNKQTPQQLAEEKGFKNIVRIIRETAKIIHELDAKKSFRGQ